MNRTNTLKLVLGMSLLWLSVAALAVNVRVDRNVISVGETVTLRYEVNRLNNANADFSDIARQFNILEQSQRRNYSIVNGKVTASVVYTFVLRPVKAGTYTIKPVRFGTEKSASVVIKVKQQSASKVPLSNADYFSEIEISPRQPYVQQETELTLRVYSLRPLRLRSSDVSVDKFNIQTKDATIMKFHSVSRYSKEISGQSYFVYSFRYKLFPQHSGSFEIPSVRTPILASYRRYGGYYSSRRSYGGLKYSSTKPMKVIVKPRPAAFKGKQWLPAVKVSLSDVWSGNPENLRVGGSVTRTVTIEALGLTAAQLPEIDNPMLPGLRAFKEKPVLSSRKDTDHIRSTRTVKMLFLPSRAGTYVIPAIKLHWWNVKAGRQELAVLPARTVKVIAAAGKNTAAPLKPGQNGQPARRSQNNGAPSTNTGGVVVANGYSVVWVWLTGFFGLVWLATMLMWWRTLKGVQLLVKHTQGSQSSSRTGPSRTAVLNSEQSLQKVVKQACDQNNPEVCRKALLDWSRLHWPKDFPTTLSQVAERLGHDSFTSEIERLNEILYASDQASVTASQSVASLWNGYPLWQAFNEAIQQRSEREPKKNSPLARLYPE